MTIPIFLARAEPLLTVIELIDVMRRVREVHGLWDLDNPSCGDEMFMAEST